MTTSGTNPQYSRGGATEEEEEEAQRERERERERKPEPEPEPEPHLARTGVELPGGPRR